MALLNILDPILNFLFGPILKLGHLWAIIIIALIINIIIIVVYKYVTDQDLMKQLKEESKELQKELKTLQGNPQKSAEVQKQFWDTSMKMMKHSFKPTFYTFIPLIIIFGWLWGNLAYVPIVPGEEFHTSMMLIDKEIENVTLIVPNGEGLELLTEATQKVIDRKVSWGLKGEEGLYILKFEVGNITTAKEVLIGGDGKSISEVNPLKRKKMMFEYLYGRSTEYLDSEEAKVIFEINSGNKPVKPLGSFSIFGWNPGWLGTYIILSILFSLGMRKIFKVY